MPWRVDDISLWSQCHFVMSSSSILPIHHQHTMASTYLPHYNTSALERSHWKGHFDRRHQIMANKTKWLYESLCDRTIACNMNSMKLVIPLHLISWKKTLNDAVTPQRQSQFTPKMKANAVPRLLSSLVWIDSGVVVSQHRLESSFMK